MPPQTRRSAVPPACARSRARERGSASSAAKRRPVTNNPFPPHTQPTHAQAGDDEGQGDRVTLSREEEPEEYWVSAAEKKGANPFKDPLAWVGVAAILLPFALLGAAIATGLVDVSVYR